MILNMFRASLCSSSGGQLYIYSIWYRHTLYGSMMHGQKTIKFHTQLFSPTSYQFLSLTSKYLPKRPVLENLQV
jgi:hypothetical protein